MTVGPHILVVDDEADVKFIIQQKFRRQMRDGGWRFTFALNGAEALQALRDHDDIDVVLTDINMPVMDGFALLRELGDMDRREVRAVVVSAYGDMTKVRSAMNLGAFDFLTKPIDLQDLESTLTKTLSVVQQLKANKPVQAGILAETQHEVSTPLRAIIMYSDRLARDADADARSHLHKIRAAGKHLLTLITDVTDFAALETGTIELHPETFQVADVVLEVADIWREDLASHGNRLTIELVNDVGTMYADITRVRQILFNVLGNAATVTTGGTLTVEVRRLANDTIQFKVLFPAPQSGSTGLGLTITRRLCAIMGGSVVDSPLAIELPAAVAVTTPHPI